MAKYRLSYLDIGGIFKDINLEKLDCLKGKKVTDIEVIDKFTTSFSNLEELLIFLKRNKIIEDKVNKLYITIDKKENKIIKNKKIYNGDKLLFNNDSSFLNISFIYKWIMSNIDNKEYVIEIADNYIEKYKNAYNRETGASYILELLYTIRNIVTNSGKKELEELKEFNDCISDFIDFEFYKLDGTKNKIKDEKGNFIKRYRNIHDFVLLIKSLEKNINKKITESKDNVNVKKIVINDNKEQFDSNKEEFITDEDFERSNREMLNGYKEYNFIPYQDGVDYIAPHTLEELKDSLDEYSKKLSR